MANYYVISDKFKAVKLFPVVINADLYTKVVGLPMAFEGDEYKLEATGSIVGTMGVTVKMGTKTITDDVATIDGLNVSITIPNPTDVITITIENIIE